MRILIISVLAFIMSHALFGQIIKTTESTDLSNIYNHALMVYCDSSLAKNSHSIMVEYESLTTSHLPKKIGNIEIKLIEYKQLIRLTSSKKSIELIRIIPLRQENGKFFVNISSYRVNRKGKNLEYSLLMGMGAKIMYRFDCNSQGFVFDKIE